jgi:hypothetical protein
MDTNGGLYGTTAYGGTLRSNGDFGCGTISEITASGGKVLYAFPNNNGGTSAAPTTTEPSSTSQRPEPKPCSIPSRAQRRGFLRSQPAEREGDALRYDHHRRNQGLRAELGLRHGFRHEGVTTLVSLDGVGAVYPTLHATGEWGTLDVKDGALLPTEYSHITVAASIAPSTASRSPSPASSGVIRGRCSSSSSPSGFPAVTATTVK